MLKKAKAQMGRGETPTAARDLPQAVLDSSHQIWLAGLGAFVKAQREGMKMFDNLVLQGTRIEHKTRQAAAETAAAAHDAARTKAKEMQKMAGGTWDKLEKVFEERVERALSKLGVYTQNDVQKLATRVDELSAAVNALLKQSGVAPKAASRKPRAAKARAKPATARKAARSRKS
jgi:poly(hydroxyalkanoate) granule-associated protein